MSMLAQTGVCWIEPASLDSWVPQVKRNKEVMQSL